MGEDWRAALVLLRAEKSMRLAMEISDPALGLELQMSVGP